MIEIIKRNFQLYGFEPLETPGFEISDATATFDKEGLSGERFSSEEVHQISLASLQNEFATVLKYEQLINME